LRRVAREGDADIATFELPICYAALTNIGTLRLLCDAGPGEKAGNEVLIQECQRATNGNCLLLWNTSFDPPGQHFLQAEFALSQRDGSSREDKQLKQVTPLRGPLFSFVSTNVIQFFPHADSYTDHGAFFRAKLAQPVGSYSLKLTTISGQHIHTITGSTTNGIAEVYWDLLYDGGKGYTDESFNSTWTVTFPDHSKTGSTNSTSAQAQSKP